MNSTTKNNTLTMQEYEDFFTNQFGFYGKLEAVKKYLQTEQNAELIYDITRKYPFITLKYDEAGNLTGKYGAASLWQVVYNSVPLTGTNEDSLKPAGGWIDYLYHKSKENINKM